MRLPRPDEYRQAVHLPQVAFLDADLCRATPRRHPVFRLPTAVSGGFALTFDLSVDGERFAVRCFHKHASHLQERYAQVADFVRTANLDFLVDVRYLESGIRVNGDVFPIVRMRWVDGVPLNAWIDNHLDSPTAIQQVRRRIVGAVTELLRRKAAHGDLQHGNILVSPSTTICLIDYDGMFLPPLRHLGASEVGHRNYQHPGRGDHFDESLDLFAALVIDLSLDALTHEPDLWKEFNTAENLLFSSDDFVTPERSGLFSRLSRIAPLAERVQRLREACGADFADVPQILSGKTKPTPEHARRPPTSAASPSRPAPVVIYAHDREKLLAHEGDEVTVVGLVVNAKTPELGADITFINFGDFRRGAFTIVAWGRTSKELRKQFNDPSSLDGSWVSVTGLLEVYTHPRRRRRTPQIELQRTRSLRVIDQAKAKALIAAARPATPSAPSASGKPKPATTAPSKPTARSQGTTSQPTNTGATSASDIQSRIGKLYSSPGFTASVTPKQPPRNRAAQPPGKATRSQGPPTRTTNPARPPQPPPVSQPPPRKSPIRPQPPRQATRPPRSPTAPTMPTPPVPPPSPPPMRSPTSRGPSPAPRQGGVPTPAMILIIAVAVFAGIIVLCCFGIMLDGVNAE